jgi:polysaccharide biosynthesis/export protein
MLLVGSAALPCSAQFAAPSPAMAPPATVTIDEPLLNSLLNAAQPDLRFRKEDIVNVVVFGTAGFGPNLRVEADGTIRFPFLGKVPVAGHTIEEVEDILTEALKEKGIVQDPQVLVTPASQPWAVVTVEGDVQRPGTFPPFGRLTLAQYISVAGGLLDNLASSNLATNSSSSSFVTLVRPTLDHPVIVPLGPDLAHSPYAEIPLFAGDEIRVGRVGQVYAVGAFRFQGAYALKNTSPTTVIQLMAQAGGIGFEGERGNTRIIRTEGTSQYVMKVNVARILKGKMADIALQPNDIVFVPTNQMKAAIKGGGTSSVVSFADAAVLADH